MKIQTTTPDPIRRPGSAAPTQPIIASTTNAFCGSDSPTRPRSVTPALDTRGSGSSSGCATSCGGRLPPGWRLPVPVIGAAVSSSSRRAAPNVLGAVPLARGQRHAAISDRRCLTGGDCRRSRSCIEPEGSSQTRYSSWRRITPQLPQRVLVEGTPQAGQRTFCSSSSAGRARRGVVAALGGAVLSPPGAGAGSGAGGTAACSTSSTDSSASAIRSSNVDFFTGAVLAAAPYDPTGAGLGLVATGDPHSRQRSLPSSRVAPQSAHFIASDAGTPSAAGSSRTRAADRKSPLAPR